MNWEGLLPGPFLERSIGDGSHRFTIMSHPLAVEGRHEQFSFPLMFVPVQEQYGICTQNWFEYPVRFAGLSVVRVSRKDLFDGSWIREKRNRRQANQAHSETIAIFSTAFVHIGYWLAHPRKCLYELRRSGTRGDSSHLKILRDCQCEGKYRLILLSRVRMTNGHRRMSAHCSGVSMQLPEPKTYLAE